MIKYHKIGKRKPANVPAGEEHIWYSYPNGLYVADLQGIPRHIAPGKQVGAETPVGVPSEPGLFYYNTSNKKNYISTADKWVEIGVSGIPGSGSGSNIAGNVLVNDTANNFTSVDVEGVLAEIAEKFPWYFGKQRLQDYTGNVNTLLASNEKYLTAAATNKPTTGWLSQRQAANGKTYGTLVGDSGALYTRVGNTFTKMASDADLKALSNSNQQTIGSLGIKTGTGLIDNGKTIFNGQVISLDPQIIQRIERVEAGPNFVKKPGDTMSGPLTMQSATGKQSQIRWNSAGSPNNVWLLDDPKGGSVGNSPYGGKYGGPRFRFHDAKRSSDFINYYPDSSLDLAIVGPRISLGNNNKTTGTTTIFNMGSNSVDIKAPNSSYPLFVVGKGGRYHFWTGAASGMNEIHSESASGGRKNLYIGGYGRVNLSHIELGAGILKTRGNIWAEGSVNIGFQSQTGEMRGTGGDNCIRMFTNKFGEKAGDGNSKQVYAALYWDYKSRNFVFDAMRTVNNSAKNAGAIYVNANGFISRSSIKYKNVKAEFTDSVLETVKNTTPYTYTLKGDTEKTEHLGFIIEKGVPDVAIQGDGVDNYALTTYLWKAVQELSAEVDELKKAQRED